MRAMQTQFLAVPAWVYGATGMTPTIMQVYLALVDRSRIQRKPPKGVGWVMKATSLRRSAVYAALAALREMGAVVDSGEDVVWLPTDDPSIHMDKQSIQVDRESMVVDEPSTQVDCTSLLENAETSDAAPGLFASKPVHTNGQVVDHAEADAVLKEWWQERKTAENPVGQKWLACRGVVRSMIAQGVKPSRVAWALRNSPVVSAAALELTIQKRIQAEEGPKRPPQPNPDAVWSEISNAWVS